jgi:hypothetical protein
LEYAIDPSSNIDPFAAKFMGIEAVVEQILKKQFYVCMNLLYLKMLAILTLHHKVVLLCISILTMLPQAASYRNCVSWTIPIK